MMPRTFRRCLPLVLLVALASTACDDAAGPVDPAGGLEVTLAPIALSLAPGAIEEVSVNVIRSGEFDGEVTLRVLGLPAGVTAAPLTIPANESFGTITLEATATATAGASTVTVTASGASVDDASAELALTVVGPAAPG
jgi:hypothetical protein